MLDVHGVGYGMLVTTDDYSRLNIGDSVKLYVYEHIREDVHDLYGFSSLDAKGLYEQLISVNGVGPKMAVGIMSIGAVDDVRGAISRGDTKWLCQASGVGKRVAERVIVDLKDKVGLAAGKDATSFLSSPSMQTVMGDEAAQALIALGYSANDAVRALESVDAALPTEQRVTLALKGAAV